MLAPDEHGDGFDSEAATIQGDNLVVRGHVRVRASGGCVERHRVVLRRDLGQREGDLQVLLGADALDGSRHLIGAKLHDGLRVADLDPAVRVAQFPPSGTGGLIDCGEVRIDRRDVNVCDSGDDLERACVCSRHFATEYSACL